MKILIKFPTRGRPNKFKNTLERYIYLSSGQHDLKFVCTFDEDDETMNTAEMRNYLDSLDVNLVYTFGKNKNKIEAINANLEGEEFDILILAADDLVPIVQSYDNIIAEEIKKSPYGLDTSLFFMSTRWTFELDIKCIMGKAYYDRFKYIYHPDYKSLFCDNEYTEVAEILGRQIKIEHEIIIHDHDNTDETFMNNQQYGIQDWFTYENRKQMKFNLIT